MIRCLTMPWAGHFASHRLTFLDLPAGINARCRRCEHTFQHALEADQTPCRREPSVSAVFMILRCVRGQGARGVAEDN